MAVNGRAVRGRPFASSREILADAACELFLEQGYETTAITEITRRAGVSRSSFFNYFASKSEILWFVCDAQLEAIETALLSSEVPVSEALALLGAGASPDTLALAIVDAQTMGVAEELNNGRAVRQLGLANAIRDRLIRDGASQLTAEVGAAGYSGALFAAVWRWADRGAGRTHLAGVIDEALQAATAVLRPESLPG